MVNALNDSAGLDAFLPIAFSAVNPERSASLDLQDFAAMALASNALPISALSLADFLQASFLLSGPDFNLRSALESLVCELGCTDASVANVAAPSTVWLAAAVLPLALLRRARRSRS